MSLIVQVEPFTLPYNYSEQSARCLLPYMGINREMNTNVILGIVFVYFAPVFRRYKIVQMWR